jgi:hypothetical protein
MRAREATPQPDAGHIPITEELDRPKWTLPPAQTVGIGLLVLAAVVAVVVWLWWPEATTQSSIDNVVAVEQPGGKNVLVSIAVTLRNLADKPIWIRSVRAAMAGSEQEFTDEAASAADHERYFQAYPDLRLAGVKPLLPETKLQPAEQRSGMIVVSFPVSKQEFDSRKSLSVILDMYDRHPVVITK